MTLVALIAFVGLIASTINLATGVEIDRLSDEPRESLAESIARLEADCGIGGESA